MQETMQYPEIASLSYDEALKESEEILNRLENTKMPIDKVIYESRRVAALIKHCKAKIGEVSKEVEEILSELQEHPSDPNEVTL